MVRRRRKRYRNDDRPRRRRRGNARDYDPIELNLSPDTKRGVAVVVFLAAGVISTLALFDLAGRFGELTSNVLQLLFGSLTGAAPLLFFGVSVSLLLGRRSQARRSEEEETLAATTRTYVGSALFTLALTGLAHLFAIEEGISTPFELVSKGEGGGYIGVFTSFPLYSLMGFIASAVVLITLTVIAFLVAFNISLHTVLNAILRFITAPFRVQPQTDKEEPVRQEPEVGVLPNVADEPVKINTMQNMGFAVNKLNEKEAEATEEAEASEELSETSIADAAREQNALPTLDIVPVRYQREQWKLPPTDLLEETTNEVQSGDIEANVKIIKKTLEDFHVTVEMGEVNVGPTVTQYTFRPAVGVKLAQIAALKNDLALALAAPSLRIEAPIPGKSLVGIEVPNKTMAIVRLRELLEADSFSKHSSNLAFTLGRDVAGHPVIEDLDKLPHLLVAGSTGSGKSVCVNTILTSFLYKNSPSELRLIVIDPKRVELTLYNGVPHLLTPVITDHKQAVNALKWMVGEMDRRYKVLAEAGKRNIAEYNDNGKNRMPYIILIVDELADLMSVAMHEVEASIVRLAQMARAVGLHLILATQRPSVNIITGLIKANITARIAFAVASQVDSRTILDSAGAESLLGRGDMLYTASYLPKPRRMQAPFVSEHEVRRVVDFLREQSGPALYQSEILERPKYVAGVPGGDDEADDEMIEAAVEEIKRARKASASLLQRRLKVGYARAARILDILEERGLIGPAEGAKPREIYFEDDI